MTTTDVLLILVACLASGVAGWKACIAFRVEPAEVALLAAQDERDQARVDQVTAWGEVAEVNRDLALTQNELRARRLSLVQLDGTRHGYVRALQRSDGAW